MSEEKKKKPEKLNVVVTGEGDENADWIKNPISQREEIEIHESLKKGND